MATQIVPDVGDIRAQDNALKVLRGFETSHRNDRKLNGVITLVRGEWAKRNNDGTVQKVSAGGLESPAVLVFRGTEGYDSKATGQVTVFENPSSMIIRTDNFSAASYNVGDLLLAKLVGGKGTLVKAATAGEQAVAVARVSTVGDGYMDLDLL